MHMFRIGKCELVTERLSMICPGGIRLRHQLRGVVILRGDSLAESRAGLILLTRGDINENPPSNEISVGNLYGASYSLCESGYFGFIFSVH